MVTITASTKNNGTVDSNESKSSVTQSRYIKGGQAQTYDSHLTYDEEFDPISGNPVFYDGVGTTPVITNQAKS